MATLSGPSVLALVGDLAGPTLWRVLQPITALEQAGYRCGWDHMDNRAAGLLLRHYDGSLVARIAWPPGARRMVENAMQEAHDRGRFVVYDLDDDLLSPEIVERQQVTNMTDGKTPVQLEVERRERLWAVSVSDGVTVSTEHLAGIVRRYTDRPVVVVPNSIDAAWFRGVLRKAPRTVPSPSIGWAGGVRPDGDFAAVAEAWRRVAARYPRVQFVVQGYAPPVLTRAVPPARLTLLPWAELARYPAGLVNVDIACCSVTADPFNLSKSPIKCYEAALAGACVVATPTLYGSEVAHGVSGLLAETADEWTAALSELVERPGRRAILARRLLRHVERHRTLEGNLHRWPAAWAAIQADARARHGRLILA